MHLVFLFSFCIIIAKSKQGIHFVNTLTHLVSSASKNSAWIVTKVENTINKNSSIVKSSFWKCSVIKHRQARKHTSANNTPPPWFFDVFYFCTMFLWKVLVKCTKLLVYNWTVQLWWLCGWLFFHEASELDAMKYVIM